MMTAVIEVTGLAKRYGGQTVVDGISFHVDQGEIFGILGPNGAGKTTAVECLEGLRNRDAGEVRILGLDPACSSARPRSRPTCCTSTPSSASTTAPPRWRPGSNAASCPAPDLTAGHAPARSG
jgi:ABC-type multidrug transport system ATPase subunit